MNEAPLGLFAVLGMVVANSAGHPLREFTTAPAADRAIEVPCDIGARPL